MNNILTLKKLHLATAIAFLGAVPLAANPAFAQAESIQVPNNAPETEVSPGTESEGANILGGGLNPVDIIHNANLSRSRSAGEFADDTSRKIPQAAEEFKKLQQQLLQQQQQQQQQQP